MRQFYIFIIWFLRFNSFSCIWVLWARMVILLLIRNHKLYLSIHTRRAHRVGRAYAATRGRRSVVDHDESGCKRHKFFFISCVMGAFTEITWCKQALPSFKRDFCKKFTNKKRWRLFPFDLSMFTFSTNIFVGKITGSVGCLSVNPSKSHSCVW